MKSTRKIAFNIGIREVVKVTKMKDIKLMLTVLLFGLGVLTMLGAGQNESSLWDLGSPDDFLSSGPVYHNGPFFYPNSDLSLGTQRFLGNYPGFMPLGYSNYPAYNPAYKPVALGSLGKYNYTPNYMQGYYYNPYSYYYNPQAGLDYAVAMHANQKYLNNYYNKYFWNYWY